MPRKVDNAIEADARRGRRATLSVERWELCNFVADVASEFGQRASSHDLRFLAYLLAMVFEEATNQSRIAAHSRWLPPASTDAVET
jgi:hypothetical protein